MARAEGKPDESLARLFDQLKSDGLAWASAEQALLEERVQSRIRRLELAAILTAIALIATLTAAATLADVAVTSLAPALGAVTAGLVIGCVLLVIALALVVWIRSLLRASPLRGRTRRTAKIIWSALNEPN